MKSRETILATVASLIAQIGIAYAVRPATQIMAGHWHEFHGGKALPPLTEFAIQYGIGVPVAATVLILLVVAVPALRVRAHLCFLGVALFEALALAALLIGLAAPGCVPITYL